MKASKIRRWQESNPEESIAPRAINGYRRGRNPQPGQFPVAALCTVKRRTVRLNDEQGLIVMYQLDERGWLRRLPERRGRKR